MRSQCLSLLIVEASSYRPLSMKRVGSTASCVRACAVVGAVVVVVVVVVTAAACWVEVAVIHQPETSKLEEFGGVKQKY